MSSNLLRLSGHNAPRGGVDLASQQVIESQVFFFGFLNKSQHILPLPSSRTMPVRIFFYLVL